MQEKVEIITNHFEHYWTKIPKNGYCEWRFDKSNLRGFVIRKDNGSNNSLFWSFKMGLSDGAFFMIKHTPLPKGNHPISSPICPMGVADTLEQ